MNYLRAVAPVHSRTSGRVHQRRGLGQLIRAAVTLILLLSAMSQAVAVDQVTGSYRVGPEDVITVTVMRHTDFSGDFYIPEDGVVNLPSVGRITAAGRTLSEIAQEITTRLRDRLNEPEVVVSLKTARMQRVYVLGAVEKPGLYDVKPGWRITEALATAGGLAAGIEAADCSVTVLRATTGKREAAKLADVFHGVDGANIGIESGDVLTVEAQETMPVYVMGKVKNPGLYRVRKDSAGVVEALTLAGGISEDAALNRVTVTNLKGVSTVVDLAPALLQGKQNANLKLQSGDLIVVPEETARVAVLGYVNEPGFYPLKNGTKLMLSDALGLAKGVDNKRGKLDAIAIIRNEGGSQRRLVYNLSKFLKSGDMAQNPEVKPGDVIYVAQTSKPDWNSILSGLASVGFLLGPL